MILKDIHKFKVKCEPVNTAMIDFQESKFIIGKHWYLFIFFFFTWGNGSRRKKEVPLTYITYTFQSPMSLSCLLAKMEESRNEQLLLPTLFLIAVLTLKQ